mgnify:CR=1 FL=1
MSTHSNVFSGLWDLELEAIEEGNFDRGGWSTVSRMDMDNQVVYVKRQSNHLCFRPNRRGLRVPTLKAEYDRINWYNRHKVHCLSVVYFGWRESDDGAQEAILITESLDGFSSLDRLLTTSEALPRQTMWQVYRSIGVAIRHMHDAGIEHYHLYPKHVFVAREAGPDGLHQVRFIDLEASRRNFGLKRRKLRDLETLGRRSIWVSKPNKLRALLGYAGTRRIDKALRYDIRTILDRTEDKQLRP